jgi:peptide/nickel transport system substrate-binding protein
MKHVEDLFTSYSQGRLSRRQFVKCLTALGLSMTTIGSILSGKASAANAGSPKRGGRFRQGLAGGATTDSLDPAVLNDSMNYNLNWQLRNTLVELNADWEPVPELAESFEPSPDASVWTFKLRQGVEFHNGKPLDAEDVVYTMNYHKDEKSKSGAKGLLDPIQEIKADGKNTVVFVLKSGNADFPYLLNDYHLTISPAGTKGDDWQKGIGTGPFVLESYEPGVRALTKRNPNYFKEGKPYFDEVETIGISDVNARTSALMTGQIDYMNRCELKTIHLLERNQNLQILKIKGTFHNTMPMHVDQAPFNDNNVRLALKYAIDREEIVKNVLRGYGSVGNDHPISPVMRYYAADLEQRQYDPDKAKFHLKKAGLSGNSFKLHAAEIGNFLDCAILYKEHAAKAGITIDIVRQPTDGYWSNVWLKEPWCCCYWNGRATVDWMLSNTYTGDAKWNDTHLKNAKLDKLVVEGRAELDEKKRADIYRECQRILRDEGGTIVYFYKDLVEAAGKKVRFGGEIAGNWEADGCKNHERWWFA